MAWYKTGTISVNQNSTSVTGSSTYFVENAKAGYIFIAADGKLYEIASITDNTSFELVSPYLGTTLVNAAYQIIPTHGLVRDLANSVQTLISDFTDIGQKAGAGKFQQGSAIAPGISFELDTNTGIYQPTDNNINIVANGVDALTANEVDTSLLAAGEIKVSTNSTGVEVFGTTQTDVLKLKGGTGTQGEVSWNVDEETLDVIQNGATLQLGQETQWHCRNNTGSTILDGTPVMATGTLGSSGRITIAPMDGTSTANGKYFLGITTEAIANDTDGKVTHFGKVRGLDTSAWSDGDVLYLSTSTIGAFQNTEPTTGLNMPVAFVIHSHLSQGVLAVRVQNNDQNTTHKNHNETVTGSWTFDQDIVMAAGKGISFAANGNAAGMSSEILDDYEEGTWTPTIVGTTSGSATVSSITSATYTKIGRTVHVAAFIRVDTSTHNVVGVVEVGGLPFSPSSDSGTGTSSYSTVFTDNTIINFRPLAGSKLRMGKGSTSTAYNDADLTSATSRVLIFSAVYETTA